MRQPGWRLALPLELESQGVAEVACCPQASELGWLWEAGRVDEANASLLLNRI